VTDLSAAGAVVELEKFDIERFVLDGKAVGCPHEYVQFEPLTGLRRTQAHEVIVVFEGDRELVREVFFQSRGRARSIIVHDAVGVRRWHAGILLGDMVPDPPLL
jgi:hypothetical protein